MELDTISKLAEIIAPFVGIVVLGWWLRGQFASVIEHSDDALAAHEKIELDRFRNIYTMTQSHHEENITRLTRLETLIENRH